MKLRQNSKCVESFWLSTTLSALRAHKYQKDTPSIVCESSHAHFSVIFRLSHTLDSHNKRQRDICVDRVETALKNNLKCMAALVRHAEEKA